MLEVSALEKGNFCHGFVYSVLLKQLVSFYIVCSFRYTWVRLAVWFYITFISTASRWFLSTVHLHSLEFSCIFLTDSRYFDHFFKQNVFNFHIKQFSRVIHLRIITAVLKRRLLKQWVIACGQVIVFPSGEIQRFWIDPRNHCIFYVWGRIRLFGDLCSFSFSKV